MIFSQELRSQDEIVASWGVGPSCPPKVSICCTTYNHEGYIRDALEGFLAQITDFPIEILVHEDASSDATAEIIREYEKRYPAIIKPIYQSVNQYSRGARPMSFNYSRATGKYLALCEGDDFWVDPLKLQKQFDFMESHHDVVVTYHDCEAISSSGRVLNKPLASRSDLSARELKKATPLYTLTTFFRNHVSDMPIEFGCARYGDLFLWSYLGQFGRGVYLRDISSAKYRVHGGGIHSSRSARRQAEMKLSTMVALLSYYDRVRDVEMVRYFKARVFIQSVGSLGLSGVLHSIFLALKRVFFLRNVFSGKS